MARPKKSHCQSQKEYALRGGVAFKEKEKERARIYRRKCCKNRVMKKKICEQTRTRVARYRERKALLNVASPDNSSPPYVNKSSETRAIYRQV
jgi:hypothetical protein